MRRLQCRFCSSVNYRHLQLAAQFGHGLRRRVPGLSGLLHLHKSTDEVRMVYCTTVAAGCSRYAIFEDVHFLLAVATNVKWRSMCRQLARGVASLGNLGNVLLYDALGHNWLQWRMKEDREDER